MVNAVFQENRWQTQVLQESSFYLFWIRVRQGPAHQILQIQPAPAKCLSLGKYLQRLESWTHMTCAVHPNHAWSLHVWWPEILRRSGAREACIESLQRLWCCETLHRPDSWCCNRMRTAGSLSSVPHLSPPRLFRLLSRISGSLCCPFC